MSWRRIGRNADFEDAPSLHRPGFSLVISTSFVTGELDDAYALIINAADAPVVTNAVDVAVDVDVVTGGMGELVAGEFTAGDDVAVDGKAQGLSDILIGESSKTMIG